MEKIIVPNLAKKKNIIVPTFFNYLSLFKGEQIMIN